MLPVFAARAIRRWSQQDITFSSPRSAPMGHQRPGMIEHTATATCSERFRWRFISRALSFSDLCQHFTGGT